MQVQPKNIAMGKESLLQDEKPNPPRYWWLKRGAIGIGLLLVMLAALRFWWGHEAERRIDALARAAHARGYPEDYQQAPVPDAQNAAVPIEEAAKKLREDGFVLGAEMYSGPLFPGWSAPSSNYRVAPPWPTELPELKATIDRYQDAMRLVRLARGRPKAVFPSTNDETQLIVSGYYRPMAELLVTTANYKHATAQDGQAVEYLNDAVMLCDTLVRAGFMSHGEPAPVDDNIVNLLERMAGELSISDHAGKEASPQQVRSLIAALLDHQAMRDGAHRQYDSATMVVNESLLVSAPRLDRITASVLDPTFKLDEVRQDEFAAGYMQSLDEPTFPSARAKLKDVPTGKHSALENLARPTTCWYTFPAELSVSGEFRMMTERRIVAIMLALRLYRFDHNGRLPASLSDLVPAYLSAVPPDPFDPANGPIRYLPNRNPPALYSVGLNGKDDGGSEKYFPLSLPVYPQWHNEDVVYPLRLPSSSPAQDHQGDEEK